MYKGKANGTILHYKNTLECKVKSHQVHKEKGKNK